MSKEELIKKLQAKAKKLRRESLFIMKEMGAGWEALFPQQTL